MLRISATAHVDVKKRDTEYQQLRGTQCHPQSQIVHMHNWPRIWEVSAFPQYPQGLLTLPL